MITTKAASLLSFLSCRARTMLGKEIKVDIKAVPTDNGWKISATNSNKAKDSQEPTFTVEDFFTREQVLSRVERLSFEHHPRIEWIEFEEPIRLPEPPKK